jgi:hypothetical protein
MNDPNLRVTVFREADEGKHVGLVLVLERCELRHFRTHERGSLIQRSYGFLIRGGGQHPGHQQNEC